MNQLEGDQGLTELKAGYKNSLGKQKARKFQRLGSRSCSLGLVKTPPDFQPPVVSTIFASCVWDSKCEIGRVYVVGRATFDLFCFCFRKQQWKVASGNSHPFLPAPQLQIMENPSTGEVKILLRKCVWWSERGRDWILNSTQITIILE